jgi:hypothetical protein
MAGDEAFDATVSDGVMRERESVDASARVAGFADSGEIGRDSRSTASNSASERCSDGGTWAASTRVAVVAGGSVEARGAGSGAGGGETALRSSVSTGTAGAGAAVDDAAGSTCGAAPSR